MKEVWQRLKQRNVSDGAYAAGSLKTYTHAHIPTHTHSKIPRVSSLRIQDNPSPFVSPKQTGKFVVSFQFTPFPLSALKAKLEMMKIRLCVCLVTVNLLAMLHCKTLRVECKCNIATMQIKSNFLMLQTFLTNCYLIR